MAAMEPRLRRARASDAPDIQRLIKAYADQGLMLPRSLSEIYDNLRDFFVVEDDAGLVGCAACHVTWEDLAEVKCMAVREDCRGQGWGRRLLEACIEDALTVGVRRAFVLTYIPGFFEARGFRRIEKSELPQKIWSECIHCVHFPDCDEIALIRDLDRA
jgi:amino-acid N-acetyltransferase